MLNDAEGFHNEKVLRMQWNDDDFKFAVYLNFSKKRIVVHISLDLSPEQMNMEALAAWTR